jgi:hypothetical protein
MSRTVGRRTVKVPRSPATVIPFEEMYLPRFLTKRVGWGSKAEARALAKELGRASILNRPTPRRPVITFMWAKGSPTESNNGYI